MANRSAMANEISSQPNITLADHSDRAAYQRLKTLLADPHPALIDIEGYTTTAFRRLYRQRNRVLQGGVTNGVALRACPSTITPSWVPARTGSLTHGMSINSLR
jgi:hypothetical protein